MKMNPSHDRKKHGIGGFAGRMLIGENRCSSSSPSVFEEIQKPPTTPIKVIQRQSRLFKAIQGKKFPDRLSRPKVASRAERAKILAPVTKGRALRLRT
jgi:hypothetical protein